MSVRPARPDWIGSYTAQLAAWSPQRLDQVLAAGRRWSLGSPLAAGGVVVFPHAAPNDCGHHVAAAVHAVLDSQVNDVLVVGVLHAWTPDMEHARARLAAGDDLTGHSLRGIHGPDLPGSRPEWQLDHSLVAWRFLLAAACAARGRSLPRVREVYPFLAGDDPTTLPHFDTVARWAADAVIVATADPFHHGPGYGDSPDAARAPEAGGLDLARAAIAESHRLLLSADFPAHLAHCVRTRNDTRDAGPLLRALRNPASIDLLDLEASDMTPFYAAPPPTWVACALSLWQPA